MNSLPSINFRTRTNGREPAEITLGLHDPVTCPAGQGTVAGRMIRKDRDYVLVHVRGHDRLVYPDDSPLQTRWRGGPFVLLAYAPELVQPVSWKRRGGNG